MSNQIKFKINYKDYPEYMFAIIAAYLPKDEGSDLRRVAGSVVFRHEDLDGCTYKNGVLHSYNDKPAVIDGYSQEWYKYGKIHREGDKPALILLLMDIDKNGTKMVSVTGKVTYQLLLRDIIKHGIKMESVIDKNTHEFSLIN